MRTFGLIPAAGKSLRMGRAKLLLPLAGRTVLECVVDAVRAGGVHEVLVVVGPENHPLHEIAQRAGAHVLRLSHETADMRATCQAGLAWLQSEFQPSPSDGWLLSPADHPTIEPTVVRALLSAAEEDLGRSIIVPVHEGKRGHPVWLRWSHVEGIRAMPEGRGLNAFIRLQRDTMELEWPSPDVLQDLDTPDDYQRLVEHARETTSDGSPDAAKSLLLFSGAHQPRNTTMSEYRIEKDSMGEVKVPARAYYASQTQRAVENFPISGLPLPKALIRALGLVKIAAATANRDLGKLKPEIADSIIRAAREVADGKLDAEFPVDIYQTGSGTSSNMNANEVISNRAIEMTGGDRFAAKKPIHPNDHVNMGQSTNDMFPTAIHVAVAVGIAKQLTPALKRLHQVIADKAKEWDSIIKIARTHLADATPIRLGQEFSGYARQLERCLHQAQQGQYAIMELPAGGTAVGTGINTHNKFGSKVAEVLAKETGVAFVEAQNHFEANANRDGLVECSGMLRSIAVSLFSLANNIRWLGSGPRCGFYEIMLPDRQPGSSIMPGKVNPVMCESMMQVCARVIGNDQTVAFSGATGGQFELNIMMPVMGLAAIESVELLASCTNAFVEFCALEMEANRAACEKQVEWSMAMVTSLNPLIGYDAAAAIAKEAFKAGKTVRELCLDKMRSGTLKKKDSAQVVSEAELSAALDPRAMTEPSK